MLMNKALFAQLFRYGLVGLANNLRGYLIYLLITWLGVNPEVAVTFMYPIGATLAYFGHAKYTFAKRHSARGVGRYVIAHVIGYSVNLGLLYFLSTRLGFPHQLVQIAAIFIVAGVLFVLFKYYVFVENRRPG
ncbi:MAG: GtrA family protein [Halothiobacillus sp.]|nr:GtrA family protein [Halothiobacillus sp.]